MLLSRFTNGDIHQESRKPMASFSRVVYVREDVADALQDALRGLVARFDLFTDKDRHGWGNQEDAYYLLAKGSQEEWTTARDALRRAEEST